MAGMMDNNVHTKPWNHLHFVRAYFLKSDTALIDIKGPMTLSRHARVRRMQYVWMVAFSFYVGWLKYIQGSYFSTDAV